jgi:hypothetical protein
MQCFHPRHISSIARTCTHQLHHNTLHCCTPCPACTQPPAQPPPCTSPQVLVLDEADRILDLGFSQALDAIIAGLPRQRQTLLFSATQAKSVKDLARLSLQVGGRGLRAAPRLCA